MAVDQGSILRNAETLLREGRPDQAIGLYREVADRLFTEGFYPKAGALLRKVLKIKPDDDEALSRLGDIAVREGRTAEARRHYAAAMAGRTARGDVPGSDAIGAKLRALDTSLAMPLVTAAIQAGDGAAAQERIAALLVADPSALAMVATAVHDRAPEHPVAVAACVDTLADHALRSGNPALAVDLLRRFARTLPDRIPVLLRLVEVGVDGGLDAVAREAQAGLADAYLAEGRAHEARVIAEDLVTGNRTDPAHVERLRRSLQLLGVTDADRLIAERLNAGIVDPLEFLEDAATPELDDVFAELRAAAEADPLADETEHAIDLARAHIDAGRTEAAIEALLHAAQSPKRRFRCASMLAQLYRDLGDIPRAIEWYERGAEAPPASPEDGARLLYDLGDLLETMGENARALAVFMEIEAGTPGFLDVSDRILRMSSGQVGG